MNSLVGAGISAGTGLIGNVVSGIFGAAKRRKAEKMVDNQISENDSTFNRDYYQDLSQRGDVQNVLKNYRDSLDTAVKNQRQRNSVTGASPATVSSQKNANMKSLSNAISAIASQGSRLKDNAKNSYQNNKTQLLSQKAKIYNDQAQQWANVGANAANAVGSAMGSYLMNDSIPKDSSSGSGIPKDGNPYIGTATDWYMNNQNNNSFKLSY